VNCLVLTILSITDSITTTAYNLRSKISDIDPDLSGDTLTATSERFVKKLTLEKMTNEDEQKTTTTHKPQDSAIMICYRECLTNLERMGAHKVLVAAHGLFSPYLHSFEIRM
jgi:hypothetical protein